MDQFNSIFGRIHKNTYCILSGGVFRILNQIVSFLIHVYV